MVTVELMCHVLLIHAIHVDVAVGVDAVLRQCLRRLLHVSSSSVWNLFLSQWRPVAETRLAHHPLHRLISTYNSIISKDRISVREPKNGEQGANFFNSVTIFADLHFI